MTDGNGHEPESLRGRYRFMPVEGSGAMLSWTTGLCERCQNCGCGNQQEPFDLTPAGSMKTFLRLRQYQKDGLPK